MLWHVSNVQSFQIWRSWTPVKFIFFAYLNLQMKEQENIGPIDQYLIDFVRELRISKDLAQEDIANIIGVSRSFVRDVESTNRRQKYNIGHINALADYFDISPRTFLPEKAIAIDHTVREKKKPAVTAKKKAGSKKTTASKKK